MRRWIAGDLRSSRHQAIRRRGVRGAASFRPPSLAHYVVAEVKNLSGRPGKDEILRVANYLNPHGTGLFALVLAWNELDDTARWICREQWVQHNKLIIGIDDEDVRQMVETRLAGSDPAELVRQKIEDFRLEI